MQRFLSFAGLSVLLTVIMVTFGKDYGIGQLPGDITLKGERYALHLPLMTCFLVSVALSGIFWLIKRFRG